MKFSCFSLSRLQLLRFGTFIFQDPENTEDKPTGYIKQREMEFAARNQHEKIEPANTDFFLQSEHNINMAPMIFFFFFLAQNTTK